MTQNWPSIMIAKTIANTDTMVKRGDNLAAIDKTIGAVTMKIEKIKEKEIISLQKGVTNNSASQITIITSTRMTHTSSKARHQLVKSIWIVFSTRLIVRK